jgi:hypothetical protein
MKHLTQNKEMDLYDMYKTRIFFKTQPKDMLLEISENIFAFCNISGLKLITTAMTPQLTV